MSTLIIGGLFVVALIALVALVFLLRGESRTSGTASANAPTNATPDVAVKSQPHELTTANTNESSSPVSSVPAPITAPITAPISESRFAMGNGQFHELSVELHTLHEQSQEIEHRLSILSEMIERIERTQDAHITEEYSSFTDKQSVN